MWADNPLTALTHSRARLSDDFKAAHREYKPPRTTLKPGGNLDDPSTLSKILPSAAADGEVMLLCMGNEGTMRMAANLILSLRAMGLHNMLTMAPDRSSCDAIWITMPTLACVWWPSIFAKPRPRSLYNDMFKKESRTLAFFEARKLLLANLVLEHRLNVLHLDGDTVWFANPYPIFKTLYKEHSLVFQTDNPFVNAGVFYVQNARKGDGAAWVLEELNRRIERFTYHPETVKELPNSGWSTPPHFANADEQANMNDIVASGLLGRNVYGNGVEFYEARFKKDKGSPEAAAKMRDGSWIHKTQQGDVTPARRKLGALSPEQPYKDVVHLCKMSLWGRADLAELRVPGNASAAHASLLEE